MFVNMKRKLKDGQSFSNNSTTHTMYFLIFNLKNMAMRTSSPVREANIDFVIITGVRLKHEWVSHV